MARKVEMRGPYVDNGDGSIDCEIRYFKPDPRAGMGWLPFTAKKDEEDKLSDGRKIYKKIIDTKKDEIIQRDETINNEIISCTIRETRNVLLGVSDWTQLPDIIDEEQKRLWAEYRQALRDLTEQEGFPNNVEWPTQPE